MRIPPVHGSASDVYARQNNYLNNSQPQVGGECESHAYAEARQTCIHGKIIIKIIPNPI